MTEKNAEKKYIERFKNDYAFRTFFFSAVSLITGAAYAAYNLFLGLAYSSAWNTGIAAYYLSLLCIRFFILSAEIKYVKKGYDEPQKEKARKRLFRIQSALLFATDISLIAPITLMVLQKKEVNFSSVHAITIAAYTTYKIIMSAINFSKAKKNGNLSVKMLRNVNLVDALVSVLSLQYALVMTFGGGIEGDMLFFVRIQLACGLGVSHYFIRRQCGKKSQKIIRAPVKRLFERPLIQFCIIINYLFQCGSFFILNLEKPTLNRVRFCFFLRRRASFRPNFFVIYQKTVENKLFHCYN